MHFVVRHHLMNVMEGVRCWKCTAAVYCSANRLQHHPSEFIQFCNITAVTDRVLLILQNLLRISIFFFCVFLARVLRRMGLAWNIIAEAETPLTGLGIKLKR